MTDDLIEGVALTIKAEVGKQLNAQPIHPDPAVDDWAGTGGEINLSEVARAAIRAAAPLILDMAADVVDDAEYAGFVRQLKERFQ
jgi:hypothetical protein